MSSSIEPENIPDFQKIGGGASRLEVTVAVKKKGKWEYPDLDDATTHAVQSAIETIRMVGSQAGATAWKEFDRDDNVLEVSNKGIYVQKGKEWTDILQDKTVEGTLRRNVKTQVKNVTTALGDPKTGEIRIRVRVKTVPKVEDFEKRVHAEESFNKELVSLQSYLHLEQVIDYLKGQGISDERLQHAQDRLDSLVDAEKDVHEVMQEVQRLLGEGNTTGAVTYYNDHMPQAYSKFSDALRVWQREQRVFSNTLGEKNPIAIDLNHGISQVETAVELFALADHVIPHAVQYDAALEQIKAVHDNYLSELSLAKTVEDAFNVLEEKERAFNQKVQAALNAFEDSSFISGLTSWTKEEIDDYKAKLKELKSQSDDILKRLEAPGARLSSGYVQDAINEFGAEMWEAHQGYINASKALIIPQKVAQGRNVSQSLAPFQLDLTHGQAFLSFLKTVSTATADAHVVDANGEKDVSNEAWQGVTAAMEATQSELQKDLQFSPLVHALNYNHGVNQQFSDRLGRFVKAYQEHRELFEQVMRSHGISDIESAFIFNHYTEALSALKEWDSRFQMIVDLANQKKYTEAMTQYGQMVEQYYPHLISKLRNVFFSVPSLQQDAVHDAFKEFATRVGFQDPTQALADLSMERAAIKQQLVVQECIDKAKEAELAVPPGLQQALTTIKNTLKKENAGKDAFSRLYNSRPSFSQLFNTGGVLNASHPLDSQWRKILAQHGWKGGDVAQYSVLMNRYAEVIRPLKMAQQAIATESDPQKKRALQAQLRGLGAQSLPELNAIQKEWESLGGTRKVRTVIDAAKTAARAFDQSPAVKRAQTEIEQLFEQNREAFAKDGFATPLDLIDKLPSFIRGVPTDQKREFVQRYAKAIELVDLINLGEELESQADYHVELMEDRVVYMNQLYADMGIYNPQQERVIARNLLQGPHSREPAFWQLLKEKGWDREKVQKLSSWYDRHQMAAYPLVEAKKALAADPENILLQHEFKKVARQQLPQLSKLSKEFNAVFGNQQKVHDLQWALLLYGNRVAKDQESLEKVVASGAVRDSADLNRQIGEKQTTLKMFSALRLTDNIERVDALAVEAERTAILPMSWDQEFLSLLMPTPKSPLMLLKPGGKEPLWTQMLSKHGITKDDIKKILGLLQNFQTQAEKIAVLERKLEADPGNEKLRKELMGELKDRSKSLLKLIEQFHALSPKIINLQQALQEYNTYLTKSIQKEKEAQQKAEMLHGVASKLINVEEQLPEIANAVTTVESTMQSTDSYLHKRTFGDLTDSQIQRLARLTSELGVMAAFNEKRSFINETYKRFGSLL